MRMNTVRRLAVQLSASIAAVGFFAGAAASAASADAVYSSDAVFAHGPGTNVEASVAGFSAGLDSVPNDGVPIAYFQDVPSSDLAGYPDSDFTAATTRSNTDGHYTVIMVCADGFSYTGPTQVFGTGVTKQLEWPTVAQRTRLDPTFVAHLRSVKPGGTDASINGCQLYPHTPTGRYIGGVSASSPDPYGAPTPGSTFLNDTVAFHVASVQLSGPDSANFGAVGVGSSGDVSITLSNPTLDHLVFTGSVRLTGSKTFQIVGDSCPGATIFGAQTCAVVVRFSPKRLGTQNAVLTFRQDNVTHSVQLTGVGSTS